MILGSLFLLGCSTTVVGSGVDETSGDGDSGETGTTMGDGDTASSDEEPCPVGAHGCECSDGACLGNLQCLGGICEQGSAAPDGTADAFVPSEQSCSGDDDAEYQVGDFTGACYRFVSEGTSWIVAKLDCVAWGGSLVTVHNEEVHAELVGLVAPHAQHGEVWIGLSSKSGTWEWTTGESPTFTSWGQTEPDQERLDQCAYAYRPSAYDWHDQDCDRLYSYACHR